MVCEGGASSGVDFHRCGPPRSAVWGLGATRLVVAAVLEEDIVNSLCHLFGFMNREGASQSDLNSDCFLESLLVIVEGILLVHVWEVLHDEAKGVGVCCHGPGLLESAETLSSVVIRIDGLEPFSQSGGKGVPGEGLSLRFCSGLFNFEPGSGALGEVIGRPLDLIVLGNLGEAEVTLHLLNPGFDGFCSFPRVIGGFARFGARSKGRGSAPLGCVQLEVADALLHVCQELSQVWLGHRGRWYHRGWERKW